MNLVFLVNYDLPALLALNRIVPACTAHNIQIFYTQKSISDLCPALKQLGEFEVKALEATSNLMSFQQLGAIALNAINTDDFSRYAAAKPDVVVSIRHMSILQAPAIAVPKLAMLNLHSGLLPDYQGVMSTFRALCHRETTIGTTLHTIENADIDRGPVIAKSQTPAQFDQSYLWNVLNLYREGSRNVIEAITQLKSGIPLTSKPQQGRGRYFTFPTATEIDAAPVSLFAQSDAEHLDQFLND